MGAWKEQIDADAETDDAKLSRFRRELAEKVGVRHATCTHHWTTRTRNIVRRCVWPFGVRLQHDGRRVHCAWKGERVQCTAAIDRTCKWISTSRRLASSVLTRTYRGNDCRTGACDRCGLPIASRPVLHAGRHPQPQRATTQWPWMAATAGARPQAMWCEGSPRPHAAAPPWRGLVMRPK